MTLAQRGKPEAMVIARIGKIADSHLGSIKQIYYGGDDLFPRANLVSSGHARRR